MLLVNSSPTATTPTPNAYPAARRLRNRQPESPSLGPPLLLTVEETDYGPKLRRWKPFSTLAVKPRIASDDLTAITPAPTPDEPNRVNPGGREKFETTP